MLPLACAKQSADRIRRRGISGRSLFIFCSSTFVGRAARIGREGAPKVSRLKRAREDRRVTPCAWLPEPARVRAPRAPLETPRAVCYTSRSTKQHTFDGGSALKGCFSVGHAGT